MQLDAPEIRDLKHSSFEVFVELLTVVVMIATWGIAINQSRLSAQTDTGMFVLPAVSTVIYLAILGVWCLSPRYYNLWESVSEENARAVYEQARRLICLLHLFVVVSFAFITWNP